MQQAIIGEHRPYVGEQPKLLAHGQQSLLWAHGRCGVVVVFQIAYGRKEHGISPHAHLVGALGIRFAHNVDGMGAADGLLVGELMVELAGNGVHHGNTLFHDFRTYTVAGKNGNS